MRTVGLATLRAMVQSRADIEADTDRHTVAWLNLEINNAIRALRGKLAADGVMVYATMASGTLPNTPTDPEDTFATLALPDDCEVVFGIDAKVHGEWRTLEGVPLRERLMLEGGHSSGAPEAWSLLSVVEGEVAIHPVPSGTVPYRMWYQQVYADLTETPAGDPPVTPSLAVLQGFEDFIAWTVVGIVAVKDDLDALKRDAAQGAANAYVELKGACRCARGAPNRRRDTRALREGYSTRGTP